MPRQHLHAFTLVEILIALALAGVFLGAGTHVFYKNKGNQHAYQMWKMQGILERELNRAYVTQNVKNRTLNRPWNAYHSIPVLLRVTRKSPLICTRATGLDMAGDTILSLHSCYYE